MENFNIPIMTFVAVIFVGIMAMMALIRRPRIDDTGLKDEKDLLQARLGMQEGDLRAALSRADRSEGLAEERKSEIDRLNGDLSKLRQRIEEGQREQKVLISAHSGLEAKEKSSLDLVATKIAEHQVATEEIKTLRGRLEEEQKSHQALKAMIASLQTQIDADRTAADEKIALLSSVREEMQTKFKQMQMNR